MATPVVLSTDGTETIQREVETSGNERGQQTLADFYEIEETAQFLQAVLPSDKKHVALQFPDSLLPDSTAVSQHLRDAFQRLTGTELQAFILADTSFGSCCVDEIAAEHVHAGAIIHYGQACLSSTLRLPVKYVFGNANINANAIADAICEFSTKPEARPVALLYDLKYHRVTKRVREALEGRCDIVRARVASEISHRPDSTSSESEQEQSTGATIVAGFDVSDAKDMAERTIIFLGEEGALLTNILLNYNQQTVVSIHPTTYRIREENASVNRLLARRFYLMQKAKDAQIIGIVVGTLGVARYLESVRHLKSIIKEAGKKSYLFAVGKINEPKMANFSEVDIYVMVSCPFNSMLDTSKYFHDVVTPYELELALVSGRDWTGTYTTNFCDVLPGGRLASTDKTKMPLEEDEKLGVRYSSVTGKLVSLDQGHDVSNTTSDSAVATRGDWQLTTTDTALKRFQTRSYKGLDPISGTESVSAVEEGLSGIAREYKAEGEAKEVDVDDMFDNLDLTGANFDDDDASEDD